MKIKFTIEIEIDIDNVPDDFDDIIKKAFRDYTEGTRKEYMYQDKLAFIDCMRRYLHNVRNIDEENEVMEIMKNLFEYQVDEFGEFPDENDFLSIEFMQNCYHEGFVKGEKDLYAHYTNNHRDDEKILKLVARAIKAVMEYED